MTQKSAGSRRQSSRVTSTLIWAGVLLWAPPILSSEASAQLLGYASAPENSFPSDNIMLAPPAPALTGEGDGSGSAIPDRLRRATVAFDTREAPGTIVIDTGNTTLYYVVGTGRAIRSAAAVRRHSFTWSASQPPSTKPQ